MTIRGNLRADLAERLEEGLRLEKAGMLDRALAIYREVREPGSDAAAAATSWRMEAYVHHARADWEAALEAARTGAALARRIGRNDLLAEALNAEAAVCCAQGRLDDAMALYEAMLVADPHPRIRGLALQNMGSIHGQRGEMELAEHRLREASQAFEAAEYEWGRAHVLNNLVAVALDRGDPVTAEELALQAIGVARQVDDHDLIAIAALNLAEAQLGLGKLDAAEEEVSRALGQFEVAGNAWRRTACFRILGDIHHAREETEFARKIWARGLELALEIQADGEIRKLTERLKGTNTP